jgi:hypothetical protein
MEYRIGSKSTWQNSAVAIKQSRQNASSGEATPRASRKDPKKEGKLQLVLDLDLKLDYPNPIQWHGQLVGSSGSAQKFPIDLAFSLVITAGVAEGKGSMSGFKQTGVESVKGVDFDIVGNCDGSSISFIIHPAIELLKIALFRGYGENLLGSQRIEGFWDVPCFCGGKCGCKGMAGMFWLEPSPTKEIIEMSKFFDPEHDGPIVGLSIEKRRLSLYFARLAIFELILGLKKRAKGQKLDPRGRHPAR